MFERQDVCEISEAAEIWEFYRPGSLVYLSVYKLAKKVAFKLITEDLTPGAQNSAELLRR